MRVSQGLAAGISSAGGKDPQGPGAVHRVEPAARAEFPEYTVDPVAQPVVGDLERFGDLPILVLFQAHQDVDLALGVTVHPVIRVVSDVGFPQEA